MPPETRLPPAAAPTPDSGEQLAQLTRSWRERLDPPTTGPGSRRGVVTQEQFAHMIGYTTGWYRRLESGEQANYSDDFLTKVATGLELDEEATTLLFRLAAGREPPAPTASASRVSIDGALQRILEAQPWPAFVYTEVWDVIAINDHMRSWFPGVAPGVNIMGWIFTSKEARTWLHRWQEDWAPRMIARLRLTMARLPDHRAINELVTHILQASSEARRLWNAADAATSLAGTVLCVNLPHHGQIQPIELFTFEATLPPHARMAHILPRLEARRPDAKCPVEPTL